MTFSKRSYKDVAGMTGVPVTTVRMRLFRARKRMEARIREWMNDDVPDQKQEEAPCADSGA